MKIKKNLILRRIGNEYIIIVPDKDIVDLTEVYTLNKTSAWIWKQFENIDFSIDDILDLVQQQYEVERDTAMKDVQTFLNTLIAGKLVID